MTYNIDNLMPGDRVRFEHESGNVIVGTVGEAPTRSVESGIGAWAITWLELEGFTLAHVEPATPPLPEEPPVGSVVRWRSRDGWYRVSVRHDEDSPGWSGAVGWRTWAELCEYGTPELLVSRTELVNEIANWVAEQGNFGLPRDIRERFLS